MTVRIEERAADVALLDRTATVDQAGERRLIEWIRAHVPSSSESILVGVGDDAAVLRPERNALQIVTMDALVEGVHFDRRFTWPADIGHKALAINLSDVAAMGAAPRNAFLSLLLPPHMTCGDFEDLVGSFLAAAAREHVGVAGGNISRSPGPLVADVTVIGQARPRRLLTRGGARAGDELYVTGSIGSAAAGLEWLRAYGRPVDVEDALIVAGEMSGPLRRFLRPDARVRLGSLIGRNRAASACVDLSDGLGDAVRQLASASGVGVVLDAGALPIEPAVRTWFERHGRDPVAAASAGGEDYELLVAVPPRARPRLEAVGKLARGVALTRIGVVTREPQLVMRCEDRDGSIAQGFAHF
ncbi:MAG: thiamine-phosphate kinase [Acidobacteria bacterium]|nr:thiamine-phosphate kinase [Acidobacteriota bacterium]